MNDKIHNIEDIRPLLSRFFAGETSRQEEKELEAFFREYDGDLPEEYAGYREMFGWYASGMDVEALPKAEAPATATGSWRKRSWAWWCSAAAILAFVVALGWHHSPAGDNPNALYAETLVVRDGIVIEGYDEIAADIEASIADGQCLSQEIDMMMNFTE